MKNWHLPVCHPAKQISGREHWGQRMRNDSVPAAQTTGLFLWPSDVRCRCISVSCIQTSVCIQEIE
jgi:hypothetical protein